MSLNPQAYTNTPGRPGVLYIDPALTAIEDAARAARLALKGQAFAQYDPNTDGLTWGYENTVVVRKASGGPSVSGGVDYGTVTLEANATNYIQYVTATGTVTTNSEGFATDDSALPLWEIETGSGSIIRMTDRRAWLDTNGDITEVGDGEGEDTTAPTFAAATIPADGAQVSIDFADMGYGLPAEDMTGFTVLVEGVSRAYTTEALLNTVVLHLASPVYAGETVTVAYTPGNVTDAAGNALAAFTAQAVTNYSEEEGGGARTLPAFDAGSYSGYGSDATTRTWSHTVSGANRYLFVNARVNGDHTITGVTWQGTPMTQLFSGNFGDQNVVVYGLVAPATGTGNIAVTASDAGEVQGVATSYANVDQSTPMDVALTGDTSSDGYGQYPSHDITTANDNSLLVDHLLGQGAPDTANGGQTRRAAAPGEITLATSEKAAATAGTYTMGWNNGGNITYRHIVTALRGS